MDNKILWHASKSSVVIESFRLFTHFGPLDAAIDRSNSAAFYGAGARFYEVSFAAKNPLRISDITDDARSNSHSLIRLVDFLHYDAKALSSKERDYVFGAATPNMTNEQHGFAVLASMLNEKGFDSLVYANDFEGRGKDSWMNLSSHQVEIVRVLTAKEAFNPTHEETHERGGLPRP